MWLHPAENSRFGAPLLCTPFSFTTAQHNDTDVRDMALDASRCPDDVRMSESGKQVSTCFS